MDKTSRDFIVDNLLCMSAYWICSGAIISSLTEYFAFSLPLSNFITGLTSTLPILQLAGGLAYGHVSRPFRFLRLTNGLWRFFLPLVFFSVLLPHWAGAPLMIISYLLSVGIFQFAAPSQTTWMTSCVEKTNPPNYYPLREVTFMVTYTILYAVSSLILDWADRTDSHQPAFVIIGVLSAVMLGASLIFLRELPPPPSMPKKAPFFTAMAEPFRDKKFRRVMIANMVWCFSGMFIGGFAALYQVRVLHVSFFQIMLWMTAANIGRTVCVNPMTRLSEKIGWKNVTAFCMGLMALCALTWTFTKRENSLFFFPVATILSAIPLAGMGIGFLKMQVYTSPEESRSVYLSVLSLLNGGASLVGSLFCSSLIHGLEQVSLESLRWVFTIGIIGALFSVLLVLRIPYEEKGA